jgi:hypothetical protein
MFLRNAWGRRLISLFLLFHLLGVLTTPNPGSFLTQALRPLYGPYMDLLGLRSSWAFFAPEAIYSPVYIDYVVARKTKMPVTGRFPGNENPYFWRDRYNRRIALARMILSNEDNLRNMFVPYLCGEYPDMESAELWRVMATEPSLEMVQKGTKKITDPAEFRLEALGTYYCPESST